MTAISKRTANGPFLTNRPSSVEETANTGSKHPLPPVQPDDYPPSIDPFDKTGSRGPGGRLDAPDLSRKKYSRFWPADQPLPVALNLQLDSPVSGDVSGCGQVNRPALLIHAQGEQFASCWFSRAVDFGDESGNPAFWMLEKTAMDTWSLFLRRVSGDVAAYHLKIKKNDSFPIKLKRGVVSKELKKWPRTITISQP